NKREGPPGLHEFEIEDAETPEQARRALRRKSLDILVVDTELADTVKDDLPKTRTSLKVIMVSERQHAGVQLPIDRETSCGFFPARAPESRLKYFLTIMLACLRNGGRNIDCRDCPVYASLNPHNLQLTRRETEIFQRLGQLQTTSEIADELGVSVKTVESHCTNIKNKLSLANSRELLQAAIDWVEGR
ncbi:MAG: response regulator transcription factor, partial [Wenzhouxiangella sp.]